MANNMYIIPTSNLEEFFDYQKLTKLLSDNIKGIEFTYNEIDNGKYIKCHITKYDDIWDSITMFKNKNISNIYLNLETTCYLIDRSHDIKTLDEMNMSDMADKYILLFEDYKPDLSKTIELRHTPYQKEQKEICNFLRSYFKCYIFDEGIHPEFIEPLNELPVNNQNKSIINKFRDFINKKNQAFIPSKNH